jgi:hypothetical protein
MGFWSHPDFTLEQARAAYKWVGIEHYFSPPDALTSIEIVASGSYPNCSLFAVWWWDITNQEREPDAPMAIPAGYTQFSFRSYESVNGEYFVMIAAEPRPIESTLPIGTIVAVRCN